MALTDTDLQVVVAHVDKRVDERVDKHVEERVDKHVERVLPAMLIKTAADTQKLIFRIEENLTRVEEHLARSEERTKQEFKALRELMQAGFAAVDKRFEDINKRFTSLQWMGTVAFVVLGIPCTTAVTIPSGCRLTIRAIRLTGSRRHRIADRYHALPRLARPPPRAVLHSVIACSL